jgi:nitrogen fixation protein FixH
MSIHDLLSGETGGRPLTGWMTLWIAIGCFGVVFAVNGLMAYYAISTFTGETELSPYEHGLAYQKDVEAAKAQAALGWSVTAHVEHEADGRAAVRIGFVDRAGAPVSGLGVTTRLISSAAAKLDRTLTLAEAGPGVYEGRADAPSGQWNLDIEAVRDGARVFKSVNRVGLR